MNCCCYLLGTDEVEEEASKNIFITKNVYYIRVIALAFLIKAFIPKFSLEGIFIAAVIFVLGEIFKVGDNLKKEVDSIV